MDCAHTKIVSQLYYSSTIIVVVGSQLLLSVTSLEVNILCTYNTNIHVLVVEYIMIKNGIGNTCTYVRDKYTRNHHEVLSYVTGFEKTLRMRSACDSRNARF